MEAILSAAGTTYWNEILDTSPDISTYNLPEVICSKSSPSKNGTETVAFLGSASHNATKFLLSSLINGYQVAPLSTLILSNTQIGQISGSLGGQLNPDFLTYKNSISKVRRINGSLLIFTSGSTGVPKGVILNSQALTNAAIASNAITKYSSTSKWLLSLPPSHIGGASIPTRAIVSGGAIVIPNDKSNEAIIQAINVWGVTHLSLVSSQFRSLIQNSSARKLLKSCQCILIGGAPTPTRLLHEAWDEGLPVAISYGMTETASHISIGFVSEPEVRNGSVGKILPNTKISIRQDNHVLITTNQCFSGYIEQDGTTTYQQDNTFVTNDYGLVTSNGYLYISGRADDVINSGGVKVSPRLIEKAAEDFGVIECYAVSIPDIKWGSRPVLWIDNSVCPESLHKHLKNTLPRISLPDYIFVTNNFPKLPSGKIDRKELVIQSQNRK
jgi:O-succinylbenzoic acid--CoA ligase